MPEPDEEQLLGYYVVRYVVSSDPTQAIERAETLERRLLKRDYDDHRNGLITVTFDDTEVEVSIVSWARLLRRRYGRAYWGDEDEEEEEDCTSDMFDLPPNAILSVIESCPEPHGKTG